MPDQNSTIDYGKPHAFDMEVGRITRVCKCGAVHGAQIHNIRIYSMDTPLPAPYSKSVNTCLAKATPDMPLFVLKPTDPTAIPVIENWYIRNLGHASKAKLADALSVRNAFRRWQEAHPDRIKNPD